MDIWENGRGPLCKDPSFMSMQEGGREFSGGSWLGWRPGRLILWHVRVSSTVGLSVSSWQLCKLRCSALLFPFSRLDCLRPVRGASFSSPLSLDLAAERSPQALPMRRHDDRRRLKLFWRHKPGPRVLAFRLGRAERLERHLRGFRSSSVSSDSSSASKQESRSSGVAGVRLRDIMDPGTNDLELELE